MEPEMMTAPEQATQIWTRLLSMAETQDMVLDVTFFALDDSASLPFADHSAGLW